LPRPKLKGTSKPQPQTKEEKDLVKAKKAQKSARVRLSHAQRAIANIARNTEDDVIAEKATESLPETYSVEEKPSQEVLFAANPGPQTDFLAAPEREVLYGGAAGGGKTYSLIVDPLRYCGNPNMNALILRRTNDELREIIHKSQEMYPQAYPGAIWREKKSQWTFPSGARIWMTYLEQEKDVLRYQGQAFTYIGFDELTQYATLMLGIIYVRVLELQTKHSPYSCGGQQTLVGRVTDGSKRCSLTLLQRVSLFGQRILRQGKR